MIRRTPLRQNSRKRAAAMRVYLKRREAYLTANPWCGVCGGTATQVHHRRGRIGVLLLDESLWLPICAPCHQAVTDRPRWAIEQGYSLPRVGGDAA